MAVFGIDGSSTGELPQMLQLKLATCQKILCKRGAGSRPTGKLTLQNSDGSKFVRGLSGGQLCRPSVCSNLLKYVAIPLCCAVYLSLQNMQFVVKIF